jgi:hypothetical protein
VFDGTRQGRIYSYSVDCEDYRLMTAGKAKLALGRARITSEITQETENLTFGVAHMGGHNVSGGIRVYRGQEHYDETSHKIVDTFRSGDFAELVRVVDREFGPGTYSLTLLFRDEQRRIIGEILRSSLEDAERAFRQVYDQGVALMRFLAASGIPAPKPLIVAAEVTLNNDLRRAFEENELELGRILALVEEAQTAGVAFDAATLEFALRRTLERMAEQFASDPGDYGVLARLEAATRMARSLPFEVVLWRVQNIYYQVMLSVYPGARLRASSDDEARAWCDTFVALGQQLSMRVE